MAISETTASQFRVEQDALRRRPGSGRSFVGRTDPAVLHQLPNRCRVFPMGPSADPRIRYPEKMCSPRQR